MKKGEPTWLDSAVVIRLNASLVAAHGGAAAAVRDTNLLGSSLARAQHLYVYTSPPPTLEELAAAYGFGLARNHAFIDGNKRTALMAIFVFLGRNGLEFDAPQAEAVIALEQVAQGSMSEEALARWIAANSKPAG